jgi:hypothetical protein
VRDEEATEDEEVERKKKRVPLLCGPCGHDLRAFRVEFRVVDLADLLTLFG